MSTSRSRKTASSGGPKSSPTTATTLTPVKKEAATLKYVPDPPNIRSLSPKGVLIESNATEPTTKIDTDVMSFLRLSDSATRRRGEKELTPSPRRGVPSVSTSFVRSCFHFVEPCACLFCELAFRIFLQQFVVVVAGLVSLLQLQLSLAYQETHLVNPRELGISIDDLLQPVASAFVGLALPQIPSSYVEVVLSRNLHRRIARRRHWFRRTLPHRHRTQKNKQRYAQTGGNKLRVAHKP